MTTTAEYARHMSSGSSSDTTLPAVDERLVAPGCGYEIDDGRLVRVPPSDYPHGERHAKVAALLQAYVVEEFTVAIDMLTRTSETSDIAPDLSINPRARDPQTGRQQLAHLAFEIVSTETFAHAARRATKLVTRGVRRVFAIDVDPERVFEWSRELETWRIVDLDSSLEDPVLTAPLSFAVLARAVSTDDAIAVALLAKGNRVLVEAHAKGAAEAIFTVLRARGLAPTLEERERILRERDPERLEQWLVGAVTCSSVSELR